MEITNNCPTVFPVCPALYSWGKGLWEVAIRKEEDSVQKRVEGVYRNGKVELDEMPDDVQDEARVIVTFLDARHVDLRARGMSEARAAELRARLATFQEDWE